MGLWAICTMLIGSFSCPAHGETLREAVCAILEFELNAVEYTLR